MHVGAGSLKGRKLKSLRGLKTRPTSQKVKDALFDTLGEVVVDAYFLDLFAGTGAVGIEALSRGAEKAFFVENNRQALQVLKENLTELGLEEKGVIIPRFLPKALEDLYGKFDLVFMDPPYRDEKIIKQILEGLLQKELLFSDSIVAAETSKNNSLPQNISSLFLIKKKSYGDTLIAYFKNTKDREEKNECL